MRGDPAAADNLICLASFYYCTPYSVQSITSSRGRNIQEPKNRYTTIVRLGYDYYGLVLIGSDYPTWPRINNYCTIIIGLALYYDINKSTLKVDAAGARRQEC